MNIHKFLKPNGSVLFQENLEGGMPRIQTEIISDSNLDVVDCFWDWKFHLSKYKHFVNSIFKAYARRYYYKIILQQLFQTGDPVLYFIWSRKSQKETKKISTSYEYKKRWESEGKIPFKEFLKEIEQRINKNH